MRANPKIDTEKAITELAVGEALVSFLDAKGRPEIVDRAYVLPPGGRIGPATPEERQRVIAGSGLAGVYDKAVDRESAYERLKGRAQAAARRRRLRARGGRQLDRFRQGFARRPPLRQRAQGQHRRSRGEERGANDRIDGRTRNRPGRAGLAAGQPTPLDPAGDSPDRRLLSSTPLRGTALAANARRRPTVLGIPVGRLRDGGTSRRGARANDLPTMFKLLRYFSLTSFVSVVIVAAILAVFYRELAVHSLIATGEANNRAVTRLLANSVWPKLVPYLATADMLPTERLAEHPDREQFAAMLAENLRGLTVVKVKVYDMGGRTVFSTDPKQIGEDKSGNPGFLGAKVGRGHERAHPSRRDQRVRTGRRERRPPVHLHSRAPQHRWRDRRRIRGLRRRDAVPGAHRAHAMDGGARRVLAPVRALRRAVRDRAACRRRDPAAIPAARRRRAGVAPRPAHARAARRGTHARARPRQRGTAGRGRRAAACRPARRAHGASRRADRPAQPDAVRGSRRTGDRPRAPAGRQARGAVPRSRSLQERQRLARPRDRATCC